MTLVRFARLFRYGAALLVAVLLAGCSSTTFVYNRLHILIPWYVDDYVDLSGGQDRQFRERLQAYLAYHRREHLPDYIALLNEVEQALAGELTPEELRILLQRGQGELAELQAETLDWALAVGETLSDAQIAAFIVSLRDKQQEYREEYLGRDEDRFRRDSADDLQDYLADYLGRLSDDQRRLVEGATAKLIRWDRFWLAERGQWIDRLEEILAREPGWQERVRVAVATRYDRAPADYRQAYDHNQALLLDTVAAIVDERSERQDRHLRRKLRSLRSDMCTLVEAVEDAGEAGRLASC